MASGKAKADAEIAPPIRFSCGACGKSLRVQEKLAGKKVKCPGCGRPTLAPMPVAEAAEAIPEIEPVADIPTPPRSRVMPAIAVVGVMIVVIGCSVYANLAFAVTDQANYRYFPPFKAYVNQNRNRSLGRGILQHRESTGEGARFRRPVPRGDGPNRVDAAGAADPSRRVVVGVRQRY